MLLCLQVACSAGSACHAVTVGAHTMASAAHPAEDKVSDVLKALRVPEDFALGTLRLSFGRHTTEQDIDTAAKCIVTAVKECWNAQS